MNGLKEEAINDNLADKVREIIITKKLPCSIREIYRQLHMDKKSFMILLAEMGAKTDNQNRLILSI